ncbi:thermostable hemolysin [Chromobacterium phragmitis]|uniref:Thermostable hemolysin n=1 Tax=Chromobacterium phragmitis TaxID=2202141 RepID=A0ABV0INR5_9NEIS
MKIRVAKHGTALWNLAATAVQEKYQNAYEAQVEPNPENFVVAMDDNQNTLACASITFAEHISLFSEQYLEKPIELLVREMWQREYYRSDIAEIGNLISNDKNASLSIIKLVPLLAWCMGAKALLCTVTPKVASLLKACDIEFEPICAADPAKVAGGARAWGSYYDSHPVTGLIHVANHRALFHRLTTSMDFVRSNHASQLETVS